MRRLRNFYFHNTTMSQGLLPKINSLFTLLPSPKNNTFVGNTVHADNDLDFGWLTSYAHVEFIFRELS